MNTKSDGDMNSLRRANLARNMAFMEQIGLGKNFDLNMRKQLDKKRKQVDAMSIIDSEPQPKHHTRRSARVQDQLQKQSEDIVGFQCRKCNNGKAYSTAHGLHIHQSQNCPASSAYRPRAYFKLTDQHLDKVFRGDQLESQTTNSLRQPNQAITIDETIFQCEEEYRDDTSECNIDLEEETPSDNCCIKTFSAAQERLCEYLFGERFLGSKSLDEMVNDIKLHYSKSTFAGLLNDHAVYKFYMECGLSRQQGVGLLSLIKAYDPACQVPNSIRGVESRMRGIVKKFNDCVKIHIPWIEKWRMHELKGFPPIKLYIRNIFEVISHLLIDPEIMLTWRSHINLRYFEAKDCNGNHVFSDVMSSSWARESEKLVHAKNIDGCLLPLIFYSDGVQVSESVHNKVTPVVITLGIFSDKLLQKDISKRVIAYIPNFKCYSKALMVSHIMAKLKVSKTKVYKL